MPDYTAAAEPAVSSIGYANAAVPTDCGVIRAADLIVID